MDTALILATGGLNSTVAISRLVTDFRVHVLHVDHGQPAAAKQRDAVRRIADALACEMHTIDFGLGESGFDVPEDGRRAPGTMLAILSHAQHLAFKQNFSQIVLGTSQLCNEEDLEVEHGGGDADMKHVFLHAATIAMELNLPSKRMLEVELPFIDVNRLDILRLGQRIGTPFHLTWSCDEPTAEPCGECRGCRSRARAFEQLGMPDPLLATASPAAS